MNSKDARLLRQYARRQYEIAIADAESKARSLTADFEPARRAAKRAPIGSKGHRRLIRWWNTLTEDQRAHARAKFREELGQ